MTRTSKLLGAVSSLVLVALSASPALAEGVSAGSLITNEVTVSFEVNGIAQIDEVATDEFMVDRKVNFTVVEVGGAATLVTPGAISQVTTFEITNLANDTLDFALSNTQQTGGAAAHAGTDGFDVTTVTYFIDTDGSGGLTAGDTQITHVDELGEDETARIFVVASVPLGLADGDIATITLAATAHAGGTAASLGTVLSTSATNVVDEVDTLLADGSGATDGDYDGVFTAKDDYEVQAAALSVVKSSVIVTDQISAPGDPQMSVPGATVRYCIAVSNAPGAQTATSLSVSDTLPASVEFVPGSILVNGTVALDGSCNLDGVAGGSFAGNIVSGALADIAGGETLTLVFETTIR